MPFDLDKINKYVIASDTDSIFFNMEPLLKKEYPELDLTDKEKTIEKIQAQVGNDHVILALSGGVDSTVAAILLSRAIGDRLHCIFVDNGLLRKDESEQVMQMYATLGLSVRKADAADVFLGALAGVTDPEKKRKII